MLQLLITSGGVTRDYSVYCDFSSVQIKEAQNVPAIMNVSILPVNAAFTIPPVMAYVQLWSTERLRSVFSGFISSFPVRRYLARMGPAQIDGMYPGDQPASRPGQLIQFDLVCTGDEFLLNSKAIPFIPAFVNRSQGDILTTLADNLCPNFFDYVHVASGDLVPYTQYDPKVSWSELAKTMGDGARHRYRVRDRKIWYQPYADAPMGIVYDEQQRTDAGFTPRDLDTSLVTIPLVNDVTVVGDAESGNNREDYFLGDGFTGNFPLLHKVFRGASTTLAKESWTNRTLNTQQWYLTDPGGNFDFSAGALNVTMNPVGAALDMGSSYLQFQNGVELAGGLNFQAGEVIWEDFSAGVLNGLYQDDSFSLAALIAGFMIDSQAGGITTTASGAVGVGMSGWWAGTPSGFTLSTNLAAGDGPGYIPFASDPGFSEGQYIQLEAEDLLVLAGWADGAVACTRAQRGTTGVAHASGTQAYVGGGSVGPRVVSRQNHSYVLQTIIAASRYTRYDQTYRTLEGEEFGGGFTTVPGSVTFTIQDYDIGAATGIFYEPVTETVTVHDVSLPAFALYALVNQRKMNMSITNTTLGIMPLGGLYAEGTPNGGWVRPNIGLFAGTVTTTAGGHVAWASGPKFDQTWVGQTITVAGNGYAIQSVTDSQHLVLAGDAGSNPVAVAYNVTLTIGLLLPLLPPSSGGFIGPVLPYADASSGSILPVPGIIVPDGGDVLTMGSGFALQAAQITAGTDADTLAFYTQSLPAAGAPIRFQSWQGQAAVARLQDQVSIAQQAYVVGDDGLRSAIVTDLNPLPRTSEDCDNAALAFLKDRARAVFNGSYKCTSLFLRGDDSDEQYWPTVGRFLNVNAPGRGINRQKMLVTQLNISVLDAVTELLAFHFSFGSDLYLEKVLKNFVDLQPARVLTTVDTAVPPDPRFTVNVTNSFLPDLNHTQIDFNNVGAEVTVQVLDGWAGYIEVRRLDTNWGRSLVRSVLTADLVAQLVLAGYPAPQRATVYQWNFFWSPLSGRDGPGPEVLFPGNPPLQTYFVAEYMTAMEAHGFNITVDTDRTLVGVFRGPLFTLPRQQYDQVWYLRPVSLPDESHVALTSRRSKVLRLRWPMPPSVPIFVGVLPGTASVQFNFNGDMRNIYGFELRWMNLPDGAPPQVLVQKPVASYADLLIDLSLTPLAVYPGNVQVQWELEAFFFNVGWQYSAALPATVVAPTQGAEGSLSSPGYLLLTPVAGAVQIDLGAGGSPIFNFRITLSPSPVTIVAPVWTGGVLTPGVSISLYLDQDSPGGRALPIFSNAGGGFVANTADQITMVGTAQTRTALVFTLHDNGFWALDSQNTGVHLT